MRRLRAALSHVNGWQLTRVYHGYTIRIMIRTFRHAGLEAFFTTGSKAGIRPEHAKRLRLQLEHLHRSGKPSDMNLPGWRFHGLHGDLAGHYSVSVSGNWRVTFAFDGTDAVLVDYRDYH